MRQQKLQIDTIASSLIDLLRMRAQQQPARRAYTFLVDGETHEEHLTYGELDRRARAIAATLQDDDVAGERALILAPQGLEYIASFFGCLYAGGIPIPMYPPPRNRVDLRIKSAHANARASVALTTTKITSGLARRLSHVPDLEGVRWIATDEVTDDRAGDWQQPAIQSDDLAYLQYTSGSTSAPKGVMVGHDTLLHHLEALRRVYQCTSDSVSVNWLPFFHDMGLVYTVLEPLYAGFHGVLMTPGAFVQKPIRWLRAITRFRATHCIAPNFAYELCVRKTTGQQREQLDLRSLKCSVNGAEPVRRDTIERFTDTFRPYGYRSQVHTPSYGLAEFTLVVSGGPIQRDPVYCPVRADALKQNRVVPASPAERNVKHVAGCGRPLLDTRIVIVDPETSTCCAADEIGEIWASGGSLTKGYWNNREATDATFHAYLADTGDGPFLRTGDLGFVKDGELFITGRLKDLVIINGRNYYPQDIELSVENSHAALRPGCGAAFSVDVAGEERLVVVQELNRHYRDPDAVDTETVVEAIRQRVWEDHGVWAHGVRLIRAGTIGKTSSGKIRRRACRQRFVEGDLELLGGWTSDVLAQRLAGAPAAAGMHVQTVPIEDGVREPERDAASESLAAADVSRKRTDELIRWLRDYASRRLNSYLIDERRSMPPHVILDMGNRGMLGLQVSEAYGGLALRTRDAMRVMEQLAAIDLSLATLFSLNNSLGVRTIERYATSAMQEALLPTLAAGRELAAFGLTEPAAGSHVGAISTVATTNGRGGWRLEGIKRWNGSGWAGVINVFAQLLDDEGKPDGLTGFIVRQGMSGVHVGPEALTMGLRGTVQTSLHLDDVPVGPVHMLGEPGNGMEVAEDALLHSRLISGAVSVGVMKRCAQLMLRFASRRSIATGRLLDNPVTLTRFSDLTAAISAVEAVTGLGTLLDGGMTLPREVGMVVKIAGSEHMWQAADTLVQLLGGRGYMENNEAPRIFRDARVYRIGEGANENLTMFLGKSVVETDRVDQFLRDRLDSPGVAQRLADAVEQIEIHCLGPNAPFIGRSEALPWLYTCAGRVATEALTLAAVRYDQGYNATNIGVRAETWVALRMKQALQRALDGTPAESALLDSRETEALVSDYREAIGDLEQTVAGEDTLLDPLLRRDPDEQRVQYQSLEAPARSEPEAPAGESSIGARDTEAVERWLIEWIADEVQCDPQNIDSNRPFLHYGMDSVRAVILTYDLTEWVGRSFPPTIVQEHPTIADFARFVAEQAGSMPDGSAVDDGVGDDNRQTPRLSEEEQQEAAEVLATIDDLSEEEVDAKLRELLETMRGTSG